MGVPERGTGHSGRRHSSRGMRAGRRNRRLAGAVLCRATLDHAKPNCPGSLPAGTHWTVTTAVETMPLGDAAETQGAGLSKRPPANRGTVDALPSSSRPTASRPHLDADHIAPLPEHPAARRIGVSVRFANDSPLPRVGGVRLRRGQCPPTAWQRTSCLPAIVPSRSTVTFSPWNQSGSVICCSGSRR